MDSIDFNGADIRGETRSIRRYSPMIWVRKRIASSENAPQPVDRCLIQMFPSRSFYQASHAARDGFDRARLTARTGIMLPVGLRPSSSAPALDSHPERRDAEWGIASLISIAQSKTRIVFIQGAKVGALG